ncbi:hypothetical protein LY76DRAFT_78330 [Colletotrichum caudatum]|nr:hypothetical protein LY76DRAFT_78330 [Colletotrichum caudatum]
MHLELVFCFSAILSYGTIAIADPNAHQTGPGKQLYRNRHIARQQLRLNTTRSVPPTRPHVTPAPTFNPATTGSSTPLAPAAYTLSNGETAIAIVGATYVAEIGGAILMVGGTAHPLAAGMIARTTGGAQTEIYRLGQLAIPENLHSTYEQLLVALMADGVVVVTASGNDAEEGSNSVTGYPALFGPATDIIVVGAVDNDGYRAPFSLARHWGPIDCLCARLRGLREWESTPRHQTSFGHLPSAAPAVAGVIAGWLSQDEHKAKLQVAGPPQRSRLGLRSPGGVIIQLAS